MAGETSIEWTDATWNPVMGCSRKSPGCEHCYAESFARRFSGAGGRYEGLINRHGTWNGVMRMAPDHIVQAPLHWMKPRRIFVNSMSDLFHENCSDGEIAGVFALMAMCPHHTFQVLTKRADRMRDFCTSTKRLGQLVWEFADSIACATNVTEHHPGAAYLNAGKAAAPWPLPNVWLGVSVEDQERADERIPLLLGTPAAVRFLSCEPLLGPLDLHAACDRFTEADPATLDWVIVGGESGPGARPFNLEWARSIVTQCQRARVPVFVKQLGAKPFLKTAYTVEFEQPGVRLSITEAEIDTTISLRDRKGGDMSEWPADLRVRESPTFGELKQ